MAAHAFLAPSAAGVWGPGGCSAYPRMAQAFPETEPNPAAREGEAAHWWLEEALHGTEHPVGAAAPNGELITGEMIEGAQAMLSDARALITAGARWRAEAAVQMPQVHPTLNWGRADFIAVDEGARTIHVKDFKFGHGYVDVFENWQGVDYAIGAVNYFQIEPGPDWRVVIMIYQPRSFHAEGPVKRWSVDWPTFATYIDRLAEAARQAVEPDAPMRTGPHCDYCEARHSCPALRAVGGLAVDLSRRGVPSNLSPQDTGLALRMIRTARERLEALETGLEARLMAEIRGGAIGTGWEIYQGFGREKWTQPIEGVVAMGALFGHNLAKPAEAITPAQARKLGIDEAVISEYSTKPAGGLKLRPLDDKSVRKAFQ